MSAAPQEIVDLVARFREHRDDYLRGDYNETQLRQDYLDPFFTNRSDKRMHDRMVAFVQTMLDLHERLAKVKTEHERTALQRQIDAADSQIDRIVYELYGLSDDEIRLVEGTAAT
jgi:hypothetical protein